MESRLRIDLVPASNATAPEGIGAGQTGCHPQAQRLILAGPGIAVRNLLERQGKAFLRYAFDDFF